MTIPKSHNWKIEQFQNSKIAKFCILYFFGIHNFKIQQLGVTKGKLNQFQNSTILNDRCK